MALEQDRRLAAIVERERARLKSFIRRRVADPRDVEDILQDVLFELVEANRRLMPIEQVTAWLFRVARNRITDLFRRAGAAGSGEAEHSSLGDGDPEESRRSLEDLLPSADAGPDALYARAVLLDELDAALEELPDEQREVFVAHEWEGRSFKELSAVSGVGVNTLLARKRRAVLYLRSRLRSVYDAARDMRD